MGGITIKIKSNKTNIKKATLLVTAVAIISKLLGFCRDIILAHYYGSSVVSDVFLSTLSLPDLIFEMIAYAVTIGFIPIATSLSKEDETDEKVRLFTSNVIGIFELVCVVFLIFIHLFSEQIVTVATPGFVGEYKLLAVKFLRIISLGMLFRTISSVFGSYLHYKHSFVPVALYGAIMDVFAIGFILLSLVLGVDFLAYGILAGLFCQMLFSVVCSLKKGYRYKFQLNFKDSNIRLMMIMFLPALASTGSSQIIQIVNRAIATTISDGGVTVTSNASKMSYFAENIVVTSLIAVLYPILAECFSNGEKEKFKQQLNESIANAFVLIIPMTVALIMFSYPIIDILFGHGEYISSVGLTSMLMKIYCGGIIGVSLNAIFTRALFASRMVWQSAVVAVASLAINVALCFAFAKGFDFGLYGIALATAITYTVSAIMSFVFLKTKYGRIFTRESLLTMLKCSLACLVMGVLVYFLYIALVSINMILALASCAIVGVIVYFAAAYLLRINLVVDNIKNIKKKLFK